ncbi:hypothetical protein ACJX0J_018860, partial [Zea mays]
MYLLLCNLYLCFYEICFLCLLCVVVLKYFWAQKGTRTVVYGAVKVEGAQQLLLGCRPGTGTLCVLSARDCPSSSTTTPRTSSTASSRPRASAGPTSTRRRGRTRSAPASRAFLRRCGWQRGRSTTRWRRTPSAPSCTTTTGPSSGSSSPSP